MTTYQIIITNVETADIHRLIAFDNAESRDNAYDTITESIMNDNRYSYEAWCGFTFTNNFFRTQYSITIHDVVTRESFNMNDLDLL